MISIYKTYEDGKLKKINKIESGCWINVVAPTKYELEIISNSTNTSLQFLNAALDKEETSRLETDDGTLIIVDIPFAEEDNDKNIFYNTYPLAIIYKNDKIITVCLKESRVLSHFINQKVNSFCTFKKLRFIFQILYRIANFYLIYLREIDRKSVLIEKRLHKSMKNKELIELLELEKSLVYFSTSLKANELTLEKILRVSNIEMYEDDKDILEDVIIENKQAIEMCSIYSNILSGTMDAFASVISNNLNIVMKFLAAITIVMAIPNMVSGLFGMNVKVPFMNLYNGFWYILLIIAIISSLVTWILVKTDMF